MTWLRRRQRGFARVLLGALCVAWLQFALLPCTMAYAAMVPPAATDVGTDGDMPCHDPAPAGDDCVYCLGHAPAGCDYPSDARADQRDTGGAVQFAPLAPSGWVGVGAPPAGLVRAGRVRALAAPPRGFQALFGRRLI